ncbi:MAG: hypothetical protein HY049_18400 [Acidobacteria bacterium]|nr:hypothetical protein [Acidobacteriota bacterium]
MTALHVAVVAALLSPLASGFPPASGVEPDSPFVAPGPPTISAEERALAADPNARAHDGVFLTVETEQDDTGVMDRTSYHLRAIVLTNEGRSVAEVAIPIESPEGSIKTWWGRTLLPDGSVLELEQSELTERVVQTRWGKPRRVFHGILPGVVPGCVVDLGWTVRDTSESLLRHVSIQREWPVRRFAYHWLPSMTRGAGWDITSGERLSIDQHKEKLSLVVTAQNLPAVVEEPLMPAPDESRATLWMYQASYVSVGAQDFWNIFAKRTEDQLTAFSSFRPPVDSALDAMAIPDGADLTTKLRTAYDWLGAHVKDARLVTAEEGETGPARPPRKERLPGEILASGEGSSAELARLYVVFARRLGAEAELIFSPDRTDHYWHHDVKTLDQFDGVMAAVRARGEPDEKLVFVSPGSGLPYGDVPWWFTGVPGLLATRKGARSVIVWDALAKENASDTRVEVSLALSGAASVGRHRACAGQQGYGDRIALRGMRPDARKRRLDELCGDGRGIEVRRAEAPGLDRLDASLRLECDGAVAAPAPEAGTADVFFVLEGPWFNAVPNLTAAKRIHPVVLDFPAIDRSVIDVGAPPGFVAAEPPATVTLRNDEGSYSLAVERTEGGFRVRREFTRLPLAIKPADYRPFRDFLQAVRLADRTRLRFVKAGAPRS